MNPFSLKDVQSVIKYISGEGIEVEHKKRNYKLQKKTKGGHSLHKDSFWLQTMTAFNQKFLRGVVRKAQSK